MGQPFSDSVAVYSAAVYPHVCGAASVLSVEQLLRQGLSPRVWGSPGLDEMLAGNQWSIPTCVGQPPPAQPAGFSLEVYPHVCGAAAQDLDGVNQGLGLSPRVWGSQRYHRLNTKNERSIPTCVGQPQLGQLA